MIVHRILVPIAAFAVLSVAAVTAVLTVPQLSEISIAWTCSANHPTEACLTRMRAMGHVWSRKSDLARAESWYARAAEHGDAASMFHLAWLYEEAGRAESQAVIRSTSNAASGGGLTEGPDALPQGNFYRAADWYRKAAEQGFAPAMNNLGELYLAGMGVPRDAAAAFQWHLAGARAGNPVAAINTALDFRLGRGVAANAAEAERWSAWTARRGTTDLGDLTLERTKLFGVGIPAKERALIRAAADQNVTVATALKPLQADPRAPTFRQVREHLQK